MNRHVASLQCTVWLSCLYLPAVAMGQYSLPGLGDPVIMPEAGTIRGRGVPLAAALVLDEFYLANPFHEILVKREGTSPLSGDFTVGPFDAGTELVFGLYAFDWANPDQEIHYFTGPGDASSPFSNPDNEPHASVRSYYAPNELHVSFYHCMDLGGDFGSPEPMLVADLLIVPEPGTLAPLLAGVVLGFRRRSS